MTKPASVKNKVKRTPKLLKGSIRHDVINPADYVKYQFPTSCEDCSHFKTEDQTCTIGYNTRWHLKAYQAQTYSLNGRVALCRFMEID